MRVAGKVIQIDVTNEQTKIRVDESLLGAAVAAVLSDHGVSHGTVSVAIVDDATIHELNRRHLSHDYPTDVLSFVLDRQGEKIDAEIVVSAEMAQSRAAEFRWSEEDELLLYVIHGALHLAGYDDGNRKLAAEMRHAEKRYLAALRNEANSVEPPREVNKNKNKSRRQSKEGSAS